MYRFRELLCFALIISILPFSVYPHPGKTDSQGGHTDSETGEYHYHHGYQAHEHVDIDGDGVLDCPFDFDDKTGQSSSETTRSHAAGGEYGEYEIITPKESKQELPIAVTVICFSLCFVLVFALFFSVRKNKKDNIQSEGIITDLSSSLFMEGKKNRELSDSVADLEKKLSESEHINARAKDFFETVLSKLTPREIAKAPDHCYISEKCYPVYDDGTEGVYCVYVNENTKIYHTALCRYKDRGVAKNIGYAKECGYKPCSRCKPRIEMSWVYPCSLYEEMNTLLGLTNHYIERQIEEERS